MKLESGYHPTPLIAKMDVERATIEMQAVFGRLEAFARQHRIGFRGAVGRQDRHSPLMADRLHHPGQEIEQIGINSDLIAGMKVPQKDRELVHDPRDRPVIIPINAAEGFLRVRIQKIEPVRTWRR
jgi:hypothetical protein